jgi:hypothetical protein
LLSASGDVFIVENPFGLISISVNDASVSNATKNIEGCRPQRGHIFIADVASWWHDPEWVASKMLNLHFINGNLKIIC